VPLSRQAIVIFRELHGQGGEFVPSSEEQQHPECGAAPPRPCEGRDQSIRVPGDCLDAAQRDGPLESGRDRATVGPARLAEISGLEVQDVDLQEMTINIRSMRHGD